MPLFLIERNFAEKLEVIRGSEGEAFTSWFRKMMSGPHASMWMWAYDGSTPFSAWTRRRHTVCMRRQAQSLSARLQGGLVFRPT